MSQSGSEKTPLLSVCVGYAATELGPRLLRLRQDAIEHRRAQLDKWLARTASSDAISGICEKLDGIIMCNVTVYEATAKSGSRRIEHTGIGKHLTYPLVPCVFGTQEYEADCISKFKETVLKAVERHFVQKYRFSNVDIRYSPQHRNFDMYIEF